MMTAGGTRPTCINGTGTGKVEREDTVEAPAEVSRDTGYCMKQSVSVHEAARCQAKCFGDIQWQFLRGASTGLSGDRRCSGTAYRVYNGDSKRLSN